MDINAVLKRYNAQIYQYAGDEIILTWKIREGMKDFSAFSSFCL
jgi:adenylate cyclase